MSGEFLKRQAVVRLALGWNGAMTAREKPKQKRAMDIEALLAWAYGQELPKVPRLDAAPAGFRCAWDKVAEWAEELSLAGLDDNRFGVVPDLFAQSLPHSDALLVHDAVCRLDEFALSLPDDWSPLDDLGDMDGHAAGVARDALDALTILNREGVRRLRRAPRRLVVKHALLGGAPDWHIDAPQVRTVSENGREKWFVREVIVADSLSGPVSMEIEVDGFDERRRIPKPNAYRKTFLDPDPTLGCVGRAEYEVWRAALDVLAEDLRGQMEDFEVVSSGRPFRPWVDGEPKPARVLPDLRPAAALDSRGARDRKKKIAHTA